MAPALPPVKLDKAGICRSELVWLTGAILFAAILRLSFPTRMAVEHFDEGVYASNFWFSAEDGYEYPARYLYAPPLLPAAIEWTMISASLFGVSPGGFIPMIPSLLAGLATVPSMWWIGRRWFGPTAGIVSAWLVAGSDFHASYSRSALTDVPVCLFLLWGIYFTCQAVQSGTRRVVILAGLFTGLAWWTKYNGWLPLAVGLAGGIAWQLALPRADRCLLVMWKRWIVVAGLAFLVWSPVLLGLQRHGGYAAVAANHRQYVNGWKQWGAAAERQLEHVGVYDNWWGIVDEIARRRQQAEGISPLEAAVLRTPGVSRTLVLLTPTILILVALSGCVAWICRKGRSRLDSSGWLLAAWIGGLTIATPCYQPYPRLVLPWLIAIWLGVGLAVQLLVDSRRFGTGRTTNGTRWKPAWCEVALAAWLLMWTFVRCGIGAEHCWRPRTSIAAAIRGLAAQMKSVTSDAGFPGDEAIAYVHGQPPFVFALKASGLTLVAPVQNLDFLNSDPPRPTFYFRTTRVYRAPAFQDRWTSANHSLEPFAQKIVFASHLVQFDDWTDVPPALMPAATSEEIQVFRVR